MPAMTTRLELSIERLGAVLVVAGPAVLEMVLVARAFAVNTRHGGRRGRRTMQEPGAEKVTERTRIAEIEDAQVFRGAGRGPTPEEEAAAERWGAFAPSTGSAYREMLDRGAWQRGEGRLP